MSDQDKFLRVKRGTHMRLQSLIDEEGYHTFDEAVDNLLVQRQHAPKLTLTVGTVDIFTCHIGSK